MKYRLSLPLLIAISAVLLGAGLRLRYVGERSMSHPEMFVPGIPLAPELSVPKPRMDLWTVVTSTLNSDTHPPGYYVLMWFVTKCFGSGTLAIRLPSVLFGIASIGLVFWLGVLIGQPIPACLAAVFLALNGYDIVWSQTARMYSMLCFLGLLTTILLLLLARGAGGRGALVAVYAALTLIGLSTHVFFWLLLAVQMGWVAANAWSLNRALPRLLSVQILTVILGSPLLAFAAYQSGNPVAALSGNAPLMAADYLQFVDLIPNSVDTADASGAPSWTPSWALTTMFLILCVVLLIMGIRRLKPAAEPLLSEPAGSFSAAWMLAAVLAVIAIFAHIAIAERHLDPKPALKYVQAMAPLPLLLAFAAIFLQRSWDRWRIRRFPGSLKLLQGGPPLVWMLALGPFLLLAMISIVFRPLMDQRGLLYLAPYLLLTLALGAIALARRSRLLALFLFLILAPLHGFSVFAYSHRITSPVNYKEFAEKLKPRIRSDDLIFLRRDWDTTPVLYYLRPDHYRLLADGFADASRRNPNARVWALLFRGETLPAAMQPALEGYREAEVVEIHMARAVRYCRDPCQ